MKLCSGCRDPQKTRADFYKDKRSKDGLQARCKECQKRAASDRYSNDPQKAKEVVRRRRDRDPVKFSEIRRASELRRYGITPEEYDALLAKQGGKCGNPGCGSTTSGHKTHKHFSVDHDHATGRIRGLLCHLCNLGIGLFKDSPERLQGAIAYLNSA